MEYGEGRTANAIGGRTARACENCLRKRARWFCAADDAFLCQACDTSVHSANQLASRHERVRLETSSSSSSFRMKGNSTAPATMTVVPQPIWHQGFTRKARTPRHKKQKKVNNIVPALVPEIGGDQESSFLDENEEQDQQLLLMQQYSVPVFEPLLFNDDHHQLLCISNSTTNNNDSIKNQGLVDHEIDLIMDENHELNFILENNNDHDMELMASDAELAEFAADVESLLRTESSAAAGEILDDDEKDNNNKRSVKIELEHESNPSPGLEMDYYFDNNKNIDTVKEEEHQDIDMKRKMKRLISLQLNYEEVMTAWDKNSNCPWINGTRPDFNSASDNPDFDFLLIDNGTSTGMEMQQQIYNKYGGSGGRNEEREARVSRYREKRRSRLFSKKIRYEVRKLNAEKRPRMKGRFVKRTT